MSAARLTAALLTCWMLAGCGGGADTNSAEAGPADPPRPPAVVQAASVDRTFLPCSACHAVGGDSTEKIGPHLRGVMGRRAGAMDGYTYTKALRESGLTWDRATLDRFLTNPAALVPGTKMAFAGLRDADQRTAVIDYLERMDRETAP